MRFEGRIEADGGIADLDHTLVIEAIGLVAETRPRFSGPDVAHAVTAICLGLPKGAMTGQEVALLAMEMMDMQQGETQG